MDFSEPFANRLCSAIASPVLADRNLLDQSAFAITDPQRRLRFIDSRKPQLQPASGARNAGCIDAISSPKFGDGLREIVADCAFGQVKCGGDFGGRTAIASAPKDLTLAVGKRIFFDIPDFSGERRINGTLTGMDVPNRFCEFAHRTILKQVATCPGVKCAAQVTGARESGEDNDAGFALGEIEVRSKLEAGALGHLDIGNDDIRSVFAGETQGLASIGGLRDYGDVWFEVKKCGESSAQHGLIFGEENADRSCRFGSHDHDIAALRSGSSRMSRVPWPCSMPSSSEKRPPSDSMRSRMPRRPLPSWALACWPSSSMMSWRWPASLVKRRRQVVAQAWRTTLVTASRRARARAVSSFGLKVAAGTESSSVTSATPAASR